MKFLLYCLYSWMEKCVENVNKLTEWHKNKNSRKDCK